MHFEYQNLNKMQNDCVRIIDEACTAVLSIYQNYTGEHSYKEDKSPLTAADTASHHILHKALSAITPHIPVISEEGTLFSCDSDLFWLVDPLDGTKEFLNKNGEFTINIALIEKGHPILGVISVPALGLTYTGGEGLPARKRNEHMVWEDITVCNHPDKSLPVKITGSRSHGNADVDAWAYKHYPQAEFLYCGSSVKFCMIAEGRAHFYPRFGRTMEWDIAAGHAILNAAGGSVVCRDGTGLTYQKPDWENPYFIARNHR